MNFKALLLTYEESKKLELLGYGYALENQDRWIDLPDDVGNSISTYDVGTTYLVKDNIAYTIYKDYLISEINTRVYLLRDRRLDNDIIN